LSVRLLFGDCIEAMAELEPESIDAIVTDPPYGLGFMDRAWDALPPGREVADAIFRVAKPGAHVLAFGGTRTYHRLACAIEDAGFEIRDQIDWLYGSGFPKSLDVSKAIDKAAGAERTEVVGTKLGRPGMATDGRNQSFDSSVNTYGSGGVLSTDISAPATADAERWQGWGTALKPAHEPIVVARKPLVGTVAANVLEHGTGAINIDGCRVAFRGEGDERESKDKNRHADYGSGEVVGYHGWQSRGDGGNYDPPGRWPANVVLDDEAAAMLDEQSGERAAGNHPATRNGREDEKVYGSGWSSGTNGDRRPTDSGGASRFFYVPKASRAERNAGLKRAANDHPTVKPIALMRWLVRLVTPPDGTVLDPFVGSGTTGIAATLEGFDFVGIEREAEYLEIAASRIDYWRAKAADDALVQESLFA
jgi:DNA modification methylase